MDTIGRVASETWQQHLEDFAADMRRRGRRYSTTKSHVAHLRTLETFALEHGVCDPWEVTARIAAEWMESRGRSRRNAWNAGRVFYGWGVRSGFVTASPFPLLTSTNCARPDLAGGFPDAWQGPIGQYVARQRAAGRRPRSVEVHLVYLRKLSRQVADPTLVTHDVLLGWLADQEWMPETRRNALAALRAFFNLAAELGIVSESPAVDLPSVRIPRGVPRPAPDDAFAAAFGVADDRQRLMLVLGAYTGLRAAEIAAVRPAADLHDGFLHVVGKGGAARRVPVHPIVEAELQAELARRRNGRLGTGFRYFQDWNAEGWLFPSPVGGHVTAGSVSKVLGALLPDAWTAHTLRHRFASRVYAGCKDIRAVQELLGHSSPTTTARYTATSDDTLRLAVGGLS